MHEKFKLILVPGSEVQVSNTPDAKPHVYQFDSEAERNAFHVGVGIAVGSEYVSFFPDEDLAKQFIRKCRSKYPN